MPKNKLINLLPQEEFEASTMGRVLRWAMGSFRIIVIVTEMIVMGAFLSRFWLDARNSNLADSIKVAKSQIEVQSDFEKEFRGLQNKLLIFKSITSAPKGSDRIAQVAGVIPSDVVVTNVTVQDQTAEVKGSAASESSVAQLMSNIKASTSVKKVELNSITSSSDVQLPISFQINITY